MSPEMPPTSVRASWGRGGASFWNGSSFSPFTSSSTTLALLLSSSGSLGGSGYFGYGCSAPADSGLEGGGLWTRTFLTGFFLAKDTGGGGASVLGREERARAKSELLGSCRPGGGSARSEGVAVEERGASV